MRETVNSSETREAVMPADVLGVARRLLDNTARYVDYRVEVEEDFYDVLQFDSDILERVQQFLESFKTLASLQLPDWVIERRLSSDDEIVTLHEATQHVFAAINTELSGWQQGGIVEGQREPLRGFVGLLYMIQQEIAEQDIKDERLRARIDREIASTKERLSAYLDL